MRPSTLGRRVAAVRYAHKLASLATPTDAEGVKATLRGIRRSVGSALARKTPALAERVRTMIAASPDTLAGKRNRALILLGFAGAFRRSELVALDVADIEETAAGLRVRGATIAIARGTIACSVRALRAWLDAAGIEYGALFRSVNKASRVATRANT